MRHIYLSGSTSFKIAEAIERAIRDGDIAPGERIASIRDAAAELRVNRNTVARAYAALREQGLLVDRGGRAGMEVAASPRVDAGMRDLPDHVVDLASGNVDPHFLPSLGAALAAIDPPQSGYDSAGDDQALMAFTAQQFAADGIDATHLAITSGALDAIERALRVQLRPGSTILVEDPGYPPLFDLLRALGFRLRPVALDDDGPLPASLAEGLTAGAQALILTPRAQNPFGCDIGTARAQEITALLARHPDLFLVLDDHWAPLAEAPLALLPGHRRRWLVVRSVAKFLGPDLRLAVTAGDMVTIDRMRRQFALGPRWVSTILQRAAHIMWASPDTAKAIALARQTYATRRSCLQAALRNKGIAVHGASGLHLWLPVPNEADTAQALMARSWAVQPGGYFRLASPPGIRISLGNFTPDMSDRLAANLEASFAQSGRPSS